MTTTPVPLKSARGVKLLVKVGDGATPEVFTTKCSINTKRGIKFTSSTNEFPAIDCANPEAVAWVLTEKTNLKASIDGAGTLNTPDVQGLFDWLTSADSKNCQVVVDVPSTDGGVIFTGAFQLTDFEISGDRGTKMECTIALVSDGAITSAANS